MMFGLLYSLKMCLAYCRYAASALPTDLQGSASVISGDSFLLVGGKCAVKCDPDIYSPDILEWVPEDETFVKRKEQLETGRMYHGAVMVGDAIVNCGQEDDMNMLHTKMKD